MDSDAKEVYQCALLAMAEGASVASFTRSIELTRTLENEADNLRRFFISQGLHLDLDLVKDYLQKNLISIPLELESLKIRKNDNYRIELSQIGFNVAKELALMEIYEYSGEFFTSSYLYFEKNATNGEWKLIKKVLHRLN